MYILEEVSFYDHEDTILEYGARAWDEVDTRSYDLDIDVDKYYKMEELGCIKFFLFKYYNVVIGMVIARIAVHQHTKQKTFGTDVIYVEPSARKSAAPDALLDEIELYCSANNISSIHIELRHGNDHPTWMSNNNYSPSGVTYIKELRT